MRTFFGRTNVTLADPEAIHHVLIGNAANYRRSPASIRVLRPITGDGLLLAQGDEWRLQRRTIAPTLAPRMMPMLTRHIMQATNRSLDRLHAGAGQPVDLLEAMQFLALEIAGRSMFSLEMQLHGAALRRLIAEYAENYSRPRLLDMLLPPSVPAPLDWGRMRFRRRWGRFVEGLIAHRLAEPPPPEPRDLFDMLRSARDPETGAGFTPGQLRDQVATMILAGHETTAATLFWATMLLAQAPQEQEWLAEEAAGVELDPATAHATMAALPRTRAVVNETLRLFPPAFAIIREAIGADRLAGVAVPRRTLVMIAPWVLHRHRAFWTEPELFIPARFLPDQAPPARFTFLPFGAGARICVGAQFAMAELVLVLASLLRHFRITRTDTRPVLPIGIVTTQPDAPAAVLLTPR